MLAAYDAIADWYDRFVREGMFISGEQVGAYRRTLGTYLSAFGQAGLLVDRAVELPPALVLRCVRI